MKLNPLILSAVFALSFICFLLGWLFAVFVLPGQKQQSLSKKNTVEPTVVAEPSKMQEEPILEEIKNNILLLFDPYKIDNMVKKNTKLEEKSSFIKKTKDSIKIKKTPSSSLSKWDNTKRKKAKQMKEDLELIYEPINLTTPINSELEKIQERYDKKNQEQLALIKEEQKYFKSEGKYSFMINIFSDQDKAFTYIKKMKKEYPMWSFLIKAHKDHVRVYLGPFPSKELAEEFKKSLPNPSPFPSLDFLKEISL